MGHARTHDFGFRFAGSQPGRATVDADEGVSAGEGFWRRLRAAVVDSLRADSPPLASALAYSHAFRALPVPNE